MPCANDECTLHQLSPYIGKLKSSIAADLIASYSKPGDCIVDPFSGAGTIPLEAVIAGRTAFASDISPYARVLSLAKLGAPKSLKSALAKAEELIDNALLLPSPDLRSIPIWVRNFFHPETLREALKFATLGRKPGNEFYMACFLGVLHHQRPGFLSYPSSHLVPYLRDKKYPKEQYPEMYEYRSLKPRLLAKIERSYKRATSHSKTGFKFRQSAVQQVDLPRSFNALITSPPYMNALDYGRDNRLRLWFIDPALVESVDNDVTKRPQAFSEAMKSLALKVEKGLQASGYCIFIVGEELKRSFASHPSEVVTAVMRENAPSLHLDKIITDNIPDIRRTRKECHGIKTEHILVFQRR